MSRIVRFAPIICVLVLGMAPVFAEEPPASAAPRPAIPYKQEPTPLEEHGPRVGWTLTILLGAAMAGVYLLRKRLPTVAGLSGGSARLQVVERNRLNPRCSLYVVRFGEQEILLAQCGDNVFRLDVPSKSSNGPTDGESLGGDRV